jgi:hypothetical protein
MGCALKVQVLEVSRTLALFALEPRTGLPSLASPGGLLGENGSHRGTSIGASGGFLDGTDSFWGTSTLKGFSFSFSLSLSLLILLFSGVLKT